MKLLSFAALFAFTLGLGAEAHAQTADSTAIVADTTLVFTFEYGSRLYPDWSEEQVVRMDDPFFLGDTEYTATVKAFMPDFRIKNGEPVNWSREMNNPAAFVCVYGDSGAVDSTWAFLNFPPHMSPRSFFTFQLKSIEGYPQPAVEEP